MSPEKRNLYVKIIINILNRSGVLFLKCFSYKEEGSEGPYRFTLEQIRKNFRDYFEILSIEETVYHGTRDPLPKALFCILRIKLH